MAAPDVAQLFRLDGRVAVVTGGSRGLGASIARGLAAAGAAVVVASRRLDACETIAEQIRGDGGVATAASCHMGEPGDIAALVQTVVDRYGGLDIVVNNAATALRFGVTDLDPAAWRKALDVNALGPLVLVQAALDPLTASDAASVVNVVSTGGLRGSQSLLGYGSAKAALIHATAVLAAELAPRGIRVNALAPGPFATKMLLTTDEDFRRAAAASTLVHRIAEPDEIIGAALFLAGPASSFVTGSVILVDGGLMA